MSDKAPPTTKSAVKPKIQVQNLNLFYHSHQVLFQVTLSIFEKQVLSLIGPSGCGKSTFLRCLNRMNDKAEGIAIFGQVLLDDEDIYRPTVDVVRLRARVGMVFQKPNPFPKSIYDNVAYGPRIHGLTRNRAELDEMVASSLKRTGLWPEVENRLDTMATSLSGGQQQRLCIARAIAVNPEVILMDEPTSALDPIATARIEELIDELRERFTLVIVTHNLQQAARISQQVAFFSKGHLVEAAETALIFTTPQDERTQAYLTGRSISPKGVDK